MNFAIMVLPLFRELSQMLVTHLRGRSSSFLTSTTDQQYFPILSLKSFFIIHIARCWETQIIRLSAIVVEVVMGDVPFHTTIMIGWCVCLQSKGSEKSNSIWNIKGFFSCSIIFTFCVEISMPTHTHTHMHPVSEGLKISPSIVSARHCS